MYDILFLYTSEYSGHGHSAKSINTVVQQLYPKINTQLFNASYFYPVLAPIISQFYLEVIKKTPQIWNYLYDNPDVKEATQEIRSLFNINNMYKLKKLLHQYKPKVMVCTHAIPANVIAYWKQRNGLDKPLVCVITDYQLHSYWVHPETDLYLVPNEDVKNQLIEHRIQESKIQISGIPVGPSFIHKTDKHTARKYFGLNSELFTVLIMGGSQGVGSIFESITNLVKLNLPIQYLIITGLNDKLYRKIKKQFSGSKNLQVFKYIKNISTAMDASDMLITKPGGLTTAEATVKCLPMILIEPLPGQEQKNSHYLIKHKLSEKCNNILELPDLIKHFYFNTSKIEKYKKRLMLFSKPYSAEICARNILGLC